MEFSSQNFADNPINFEEMLSYVIDMNFQFKMPHGNNRGTVHVSPDKKWAFWDLNDSDGSWITFNDDSNYYIFSLIDSKMFEVGSFYVHKDPDNIDGSSGEWKNIPAQIQQ